MQSMPMRSMADERFVIPAGTHWNDVREMPRDVGKAIQNAFRAIESANPDRLDGIFGAAPDNAVIASRSPMSRNQAQGVPYN